MTWGVTSTEKPAEDHQQVSSVSGTVPVMDTMTKTKKDHEVSYASTSSYVAGISKVIGGLLCIIFGLLQCYSLSRMQLLGKVPCGYGEVCGIMFIITGSVAINASKRKTEKRIAASMCLAFISLMVSAAVWVWMIYFAATKYWYMKGQFYRRHRHHHHHSGQGGREERSIFSQYGDSSRSMPIVWMAATIFIFVMLTAMFSASVIQAVVCYRAFKSGKKYRTDEEDTTYIVPFKTKERMLADVNDLPKVQDAPKVQKDNFYV